MEAINSLVARYNAALSRERNLAGEFAHELRTPLASIALQASNAAALPDGAERSRALEQLRTDALRAGEVLAHLLTLARASRTDLDEAAQPVDLAALARQLVTDFAPVADESGHALALAADVPLTVVGHAVLLEIALRNLIENALAHTPAGTVVEVRVDADARVLEVRDEPPAEPAQEKRATKLGLGLGLGQRVVEKIAAVHGAGFRQVDAEGGGRSYRIEFPARRDA